MRALDRRRKPEPTIALINIVFLMLIFFLVAGRLTPPLDPEVQLVDTQALESEVPSLTLVLRSDGSLWFRGQAGVAPATYVESLREDEPTARIMPDRAASAQKLVALSDELRRLGAKRVLIVTEKAQP